MPLHLDRTLRLGPLRAHLSTRGVSWTLRVGRWSWNSRSRTQRVDLPGPLTWTGRRRRRR
ncbi:DUF4236 domain-containing protein [Kineococcus glutinatus]|uniref:DUF4236 domain-containing protein n=1 Tax=Kineococcus glutinatus TaxID=1070872 RepID=A0ABP8VKH5_9ACTN